jgi:hypothetical protein
MPGLGLENPEEVYNLECLVPTVKHGARSVMIWVAISWYSADPVITLNGQITAGDYMDILLNRVHCMVQMFSNSAAVFIDDSSPIHKARSVQSWLEEHEDILKHFSWPAHSPELNIIEPLWSVLDSRLRSRFPFPSSLKQLEDVLHG